MTSESLPYLLKESLTELGIVQHGITRRDTHATSRPTAMSAIRTAATLVSGVCATIVFMTAVRVVARLAPQSPWIDRLLKWWAQAWLQPAGIKVTVEGIHHLQPGQAYVVVSNHLSHFDIMVLLAALPIPVRFAAMKKMFGVPILGPAMRATGMIEVDRRSPEHDRINTQASTILNTGKSLAVYPEGRHSRSGQVEEFKLGAFKVAINNQAQVLPVTSYGTRGIWGPGRRLVRGGPVTVAIGPPYRTEQLEPGDAPMLRDAVRETISSTYQTMSGLSPGSDPTPNTIDITIHQEKEQDNDNRNQRRTPPRAA